MPKSPELQITGDHFRKDPNNRNIYRLKTNGVEIVASRIPSEKEMADKASPETNKAIRQLVQNTLVNLGIDFDNEVSETDSYEIYFPQIKIGDDTSIKLGINDAVIAFSDLSSMDYFVRMALKLAGQGANAHEIYSEISKNYADKINTTKNSNN